MLAGIVILVAMPLGIATAVYLEEYAPENRFTNVVRLNIRNLAGVPSVVYGILGLAVFVQLMGTDIDTVPVIGGASRTSSASRASPAARRSSRVASRCRSSCSRS